MAMLADARRCSYFELGLPVGRLSTRERDPGNKLVRRISGAEPAACRGPESKAKEGVIFAINKKMFKSFLP